MAITVNGQILRNLPEQVSKNTEDIIELQDASNNQEIRITALEGNAIALATFQDCTFTGTTTFAGPLNSSDGFTFGDDGYIAGDLSVGGDFAVTGSSTFTGAINASSASIGSLTVAANESIGGNLSVSGNAEIFEQIVDQYSNARFIEGDVTMNAITGVTQTFGKWSLSGTHLMIVVAGSTEANTTIGDNTTFADISLPRWIMDKIIPGSFGGGQFVSANNQKFFTSSYTFSEKVLALFKISSSKLRILNNAGSFTLTNATEFRIEYDLIIS